MKSLISFFENPQKKKKKKSNFFKVESLIEK